MKHYYILIVLLLATNFVFGQTIDDVVRYGRTQNIATARAAAMGGAMGALGGDLGSLGVNPAGIGVFRRTEFSLSPTLNTAKTVSNGLGTNKTSFQLGSIGTVISIYNPNAPWRSFNFGFNYSSSNNFNRETNQVIYDSENSMIDAWVLEANDGSNADRLDLAWDTHLLGFDSVQGLYNSGELANGVNVNQFNYIKESGRQNEYNISFGTNYQDKLYLGLSIGIESFDYTYRSTYNERTPIAETGLDQFWWDQNIYTSGTGANFGVGVIYRPIPELRLGASIKTPTYYSVSDDYDEVMESLFFNEDAEGNNSYINNLIYNSLDYQMRSPWKATFSLATVLKQRLILSLDYEYNNYKSANFSSIDFGPNSYDERGGLNDQIKSDLINTNNIRLGAEYRVNSVFSLRAGYMFKDSPYKFANDIVFNAYSGGIGFNFGHVYVDAAYIYKQSNNETVFYSYQAQSAAFENFPRIESAISNNKYINHETKLTIGFRF